ncbi:ornithine cyclodeaminase family protein [Virgibacillus phasianinus]|nr:ornithine cyclodeaminase family protein [Virgibacillus phasianinus]
MIYLSAADIRSTVSMCDVITAIDQAYEQYEKDSFTMPARMQVNQGGNTLLAMPCFTKDSIGTKLVTLFPENKSHPAIHGVVVLKSGTTGEIQAILDGSFITGFRTGAIGGSAIRSLSPETSSTLAIIGTGVQGLYQTIAACSVRPISDIYLYNRTPERIPSFIKQVKEFIGETIRIHTVGSSEEAVNSAEIIITTTTSKDPVIPNNSNLFRNKLLVGIGSFQPSMQEFPEAVYYNTDQVFIDSLDAIHESGDIITPLKNGWLTKDSIISFSSHLSSRNKVMPGNGKSVIFKSTGMALFDVVVAADIYEKAVKKGIGTKLE